MNRKPCPFEKEALQEFALSLVQCGKAGERRTIAAVERWWNAPDAAVPVRALLDLVEIVFLDAIRRIGHDRMDAAGGYPAHQFEAIGVDNL